MRVLVTGAAGRLGRTVTRVLARRGHAVRSTDRVRPAEEHPGFELANLLDAAAVRRLFDGTNAVVHLANHSSLASGPPGDRLLSENTTMNANVFEASVQAGAERLVFASSIQAMIPMPGGVPPGPPYPLPFLPLDGSAEANPGSNSYARSKVLGELLLESIPATVAGVACTSLRFPFLADEWWMGRFRPGNSVAYDSLAFGEALSFLALDDAAELIATILERARAGYHRYFPAQSLEIQDVPVSALIERHYAHVPLTRELAEITSLVDGVALRNELEWEPARRPPVVLERPKRWPRI